MVDAAPPGLPVASKTSRLPALDALRAIAILLVLGRHLPAPLPPLPSGVRSVIDLWDKCGWAGVDLFFVLSGFLVSGLLFHEFRVRGHLRVRRFLVRRGFKIYPAFYIFLLVTALHGGRPHAPLSAWLDECFFLQNYRFGLWDHTWSLAVEEHFYLLLALALFMLARFARPGRDPFAVLVPATALVAVAAFVGRLLTIRSHPGDWRLVMLPTHLRIDALLFGVLLSYWYHRDRERLMTAVRARRFVIGVASALAISTCLVFDVRGPFMETVGLVLLYLGFGGVLLLSLLPTPTSRPRNPLLAAASWVGFYSYSIYLWHYAVQHQADHLHNRALALAVYLIGSIVVGVAMAKLIERPFLAIRDQLT